MSEHDTAQDTVKVTREVPGITMLRLNRPDKHNAFGPALMQDMIDTLEALKQDAGTRVLIITGEGRSFSAGADLNYMKSMIDFSHEENVADANRLAQMLECINHFPCPVIAAVNGHCIAGATGIIACSDIVIAASDARFCISEVKLGIAPAVISPYVVARMGVHNARRFFLTAEMFDAETARRCNLVHEVVPPDALLVSAGQFARAMLRNAPGALDETKTLIHRVAPVHVDPQVREYCCELIARLRAGEEGQQGLAAFFDKTEPPWLSDEDE